MALHGFTYAYICLHMRTYVPLQQDGRINPAMQTLQLNWRKKFSNKFLPAFSSDHPVYSAPLCGPFAMLYWQSCADVRPMCYIIPSVHVRSYIQK